MTRIAPVPTSDEIVAVLSSDQYEGRLYPAGYLGTLVWWARGGKGNPDNSRTRNDSGVPIVSASRIKPVLQQMVADRILDVAMAPTSRDVLRGVKSDPALAAVYGHTRDGASYYGLAQVLADSRERARALDEKARHDAELSQALVARHGHRVRDIQVKDGMVTMTATLAQAHALLGEVG